MLFSRASYVALCNIYIFHLRCLSLVSTGVFLGDQTAISQPGNQSTNQSISNSQSQEMLNLMTALRCGYRILLWCFFLILLPVFVCSLITFFSQSEKKKMDIHQDKRPTGTDEKDVHQLRSRHEGSVRESEWWRICFLIRARWSENKVR